MSVTDDLARLSDAEDFFAYLDVPYDQKVLNVTRLHILRRMADRLAEGARERAGSLDGSDDATARAHYRAHLEAAYRDFAERSPLDQRLFKVLKDAVREKSAGRAGFVPLSDLVQGDVQKKEG